MGRTAAERRRDVESPANRQRQPRAAPALAKADPSAGRNGERRVRGHGDSVDCCVDVGAGDRARHGARRDQFGTHQRNLERRSHRPVAKDEIGKPV
jgi:hypothetical protein